MRVLFDTFKAICKQAVSAQSFVGANSILGDAATKADILDRIDALRPNYLLVKEHDDILAQSGIIGTKFSVDHLNRQIDIASGAIAAEERAIFNIEPAAGQFFPPMLLEGWVLSPDSTALASEVEVHYRFVSTDPWHKLLQTDSVLVSSTLQLSLFLPAMLGAPKTINKLLVLARQV